MNSLPHSARVQVIVYVHTGIDVARACLQSVPQTFPGRDLIIVLEAAPHPEVCSYLSQFAAAHGSLVMENLDHLGFRKSVVKALDIAHAEYAVVLDAHVESSASGLHALVEVLHLNKSIEAVVPLTRHQLLEAMPASSFIGAATPNLLEIALANSGLSLEPVLTAGELDSYSCFALRCSSRHKLALWRYAADTVSESFDLARTSKCCIDDLSSAAHNQSAASPRLFENSVTLPLLAAPIQQALKQSVLFLVPARALADTENHSMLREMQALRDCGMNAVACTDEHAMAEMSAAFDIVVATGTASARSLLKALTRAPHIAPIYYLQDYEPWSSATESRQAEAERTLADAAAFRFVAGSEWLCRTMRQRHRIDVTRIPLGVATDRIANLEAEIPGASDPLMITASIRTDEISGNAANALRILRKVKVKHGGKVDIRVFGCTDEELDRMDEARGFRFHNLSLLRSHDVPEVLAGADVVADLSTYRAVARLGLQAMAAGCVSILPAEGGACEFATDGRDCLLVDTTNEQEVVDAFDRLIADRDLLNRLKHHAVQTAQSHPIHKSVWAQLQLFSECLSHAKV